MMLTAGSLFAGIGGFDLAAERAGMAVAWQSENDRHASNVLAHHWPNVPNFGDIHDLTRPPTVDVLTGGFPCQDYSVAGKGAGLAGDRGALWWQFHRVVAECRPTWVVGENVHGLTTRPHRGAFTTIVGSLVRLGYGVVWRVFDAQWFGVAQRRRRVFIVGHSGGVPRPEVLALGQGVCGDLAPSREAGQRVAALTASSVGGGGGPDDNAAQASHLIGVFNWQANSFAGDLGVKRDHTDSLHSGQTPAVALVGALRGADGGSSRGRMVVRRLTPLEAERLQGFPDGWTATPGNSDSQRYRQLGNAVAVPVGTWIMRRIGEAARIDPGGGMMPTRCGACGEPSHRYGTADTGHQFDPMACVQLLRGELAAVRDCQVVEAVDRGPYAALEFVEVDKPGRYWLVPIEGEE